MKKLLMVLSLIAVVADVSAQAQRISQWSALSGPPTMPYEDPLFKATTNGVEWTYRFVGDGVSLGGRRGGMHISATTDRRMIGDLVIPESLEGKPVREIGDWAFCGFIGFKSLTIPSSVKSIGTKAFDDCSNLESVTIPEGVTSIGAGAFEDCPRLESVTIPSSVTSIGNGAFARCSKLKSVTIKEGVASISDHAFQECGGLESVSIPEGMISIGKNAFAQCFVLTSVTIPSSVTSIGKGAFVDCHALKSIDVNKANPTFVSTNGLLCSKDGCRLVSGRNGDVTIPDGVTTIDDLAFSGLWLRSVTIPSSVTSLGASAFNGCCLKSLTIPSSVTSIGKGAFSQCGELESIDVDSANQTFISTNGLLCSKDGRLLIQGVNGDVTIPSNVTSIEGLAFYGRHNLKSVTIPPSVASIGAEAFKGCLRLTSVVIPPSVTNIGDRAFAYCYELKSVRIMSRLTRVGYSAFWSCHKLKTIDVWGFRGSDPNGGVRVVGLCGNCGIMYAMRPLRNFKGLSRVRPQWWGSGGGVVRKLWYNVRYEAVA